MPENRKLKVFLCHSKDDKPRVRELYRRLVADGFDAWLDEERLMPGQDWDLEIRKAVRESNVVIVCLSNNSITKAGYVQKEIRFALDVAEEQPEDAIFIIPARLEEDCQVPTRLSRWQWVNLFDENGYQRLRQSLASREIFSSKPVLKPTAKSNIKHGFYQKRKVQSLRLIFVALFSVFAVVALYLRNYVESSKQVEATLTQGALDQDATLQSFDFNEATTPTSSNPQDQIDNLLGIRRLQFNPVLNIGQDIQIAKMAASENNLYMLDSNHGNILRASFLGDYLKLDNSFNCQPGVYANYEVGMLVDILALPKVNALGAQVLGIDARGNLLYCSPGQVPQVLPLHPLPNTNWGQISSFTLDNGNLYILDVISRSVWVFVGKESKFVDAPYFFFGNQIPNIDDAIDIAVSGDDLYLLYPDGNLSFCAFSRIAEAQTRCNNISKITYPPAFQDTDLFTKAHIIQMVLSAPPTPIIYLLDTASKGILQVSPSSKELLGQLRSVLGEENFLSSSSITAMTISPNYVLFIATDSQIYFSQIP